MTPGAHLLISWIATVEILETRRERVIVSLSGLAPDLDGLGLIIDKWSGYTSYYERFHHHLGHGLFAALVIATLASLIAHSRKATVWILSVAVVHIHILCDLIGSRGRDGYQWPLHYLYPFNPDYQLTWQYQWQLDAWSNQLIIALLLLANLYYAATKRLTFSEVISGRLNDGAMKMGFKYFKPGPKNR